MDEAINGLRRIPGTRIETTSTANQIDWPVFNEDTISTNVSHNVGQEGAGPRS